MYSAYNKKLLIPTFADYEEDQAEQWKKESEKWASLSNTLSEKL
jgi:hypothetical protein